MGFLYGQSQDALEISYGEKRAEPDKPVKKAGLNPTAVRDILEHDSNPLPRIDTFAKLCRTLDISPHQLSPLFAKLYLHEQDPFDKFREPDENEKDAHPVHEVTPELLASLNEWCARKKDSQPVSKTDHGD